MVRVFGLLIAAVALMAPANAALLTYDFSSSRAATVFSAAQGATASDFDGGEVNASSVRVAAGPGLTGSFVVTAGGKLTITDYVSKGRKSDRLGGFSGSGATISIQYQVDTGSGFGALQSLTSYVATNTLTDFSRTIAPPLVLDPGQKVKFVLTTNLTSGSSVWFEQDFITLNGSAAAVPEPASIAIFGLMGAGLAVRRFRRK